MHVVPIVRKVERIMIILVQKPATATLVFLCCNGQDTSVPSGAVASIYFLDKNAVVQDPWVKEYHPLSGSCSFSSSIYCKATL